MNQPNPKPAHTGTDAWFAMGDDNVVEERRVSPTHEQATVVARSQRRATRAGLIAAGIAVLLIAVVGLVAHFKKGKVAAPPVAAIVPPTAAAPAPPAPAPAPPAPAPTPAPAPAAAAAPAEPVAPAAPAPVAKAVKRKPAHKPAPAKLVAKKRR
jgi:hypothetical protein